jgi:16S rRNA (cytidine1402-2'-O)-methyltransferase
MTEGAGSPLPRRYADRQPRRRVGARARDAEGLGLRHLRGHAAQPEAARAPRHRPAAREPAGLRRGAAREGHRRAAGEGRDAGSPGICDPGERLVAEAVALGVDVVPIPGPCALVAALSASGLPSGRFHFLGFLPREKGEARAMLEEVAGLRATLVLYEAANRTRATLALLLELLGPRRAAVARELTKVHEQLVRGTLGELEVEEKGEVVIVVEGRTGHQRWSEAEVRAALAAGLERGDRLKELSAEIAERAGWTGRDVYRLGLSLKK